MKALDSFLSNMTQIFGIIFLDVKNGAYSTDDDKHKARSTKSIAEDFVRKRHSVGGWLWQCDAHDRFCVKWFHHRRRNE